MLFVNSAQFINQAYSHAQIQQNQRIKLVCGS